MNEKLIEQLRKRTIAVENDGTLEELRKVLKYAFPNDKTKISGAFKYYYKYYYKLYHKSCVWEWISSDETNLPIHSVKEFLTQEKQIMKVTDLKENECIHCETEEQAIAICKLMHEAGLRWNNCDSYFLINNYCIYTSQTCYIPKKGTLSSLNYAKKSKYTIYKAEQFLKEEIMETKITLANQSQEINIIPKDGFEIDLEKSDFKNGKVLFKEVKYPYVFMYDINRQGETEEIDLSQKYGHKLDILDVLLCLRDEYNRIDRFEYGFRFGVNNNWCITNINNILDVDKWGRNNKIMHFGKKETAELFLKNFKEQLETVKEFL